MTELEVGAVVWADLGVGHGREQSGRRPAVVVSSPDHLDIAKTLVTVVVCTSRDRGWPNHVRLTGETGLSRSTYAMTEQIRTIDRARVVDPSGRIDDDCLASVGRWLRGWIV